jgi:gluconokinase
VYLRGSRELLQERLAGRAGHFFPSSLLDSQLASLEEPTDALVADIGASPAELVSEIVSRLQLRPAPRGDAAW